MTVKQFQPIEGMDRWSTLTKEEQEIVKTEEGGIRNDLKAIGHSRLSVGKRLQRWSEILSPKGLFKAFVEQRFNMTRSSAYNYINLYDAAFKVAPKVVEIAIERNYKAVNRPGVFVKNPPPKTSDVKTIVDYLNKLETQKKRRRTPPTEDELLRKALHAVTVAWSQVPDSHKKSWGNLLFGMQLTSFGITRSMSFDAIEVPEHLKVVRGRPKGSTKGPAEKKSEKKAA